MFFVYAHYKTRQQAEEALEDCYAFGEISLGEGARIERQNGRWCILLPAF